MCLRACPCPLRLSSHLSNSAGSENPNAHILHEYVMHCCGALHWPSGAGDAVLRSLFTSVHERNKSFGEWGKGPSTSWLLLLLLLLAVYAENAGTSCSVCVCGCVRCFGVCCEICYAAASTQPDRQSSVSHDRVNGTRNCERHRTSENVCYVRCAAMFGFCATVLKANRVLGATASDARDVLASLIETINCEHILVSFLCIVFD